MRQTSGFEVEKLTEVSCKDPDPRKSPHPDGAFFTLAIAPAIALFVLLLLFVLYRRADAITYVIGTRSAVSGRELVLVTIG